METYQTQAQLFKVLMHPTRLAILNELRPLVNRLPVAELLKHLVDRVDYRAVLASADDDGSAGRLWRNLDKLVEDAQVSQQVSVRNFIEMLKVLNDAGAREGEAPAEALGTVRLMTIHKAKGLEWDKVYLISANTYDYPAGLPGDTYISEKWFIRDHLNVQAEVLAGLYSGLRADGVEFLAVSVGEEEATVRAHAEKNSVKRRACAR